MSSVTYLPASSRTHRRTVWQHGTTLTGSAHGLPSACPAYLTMLPLSTSFTRLFRLYATHTATTPACVTLAGGITTTHPVTYLPPALPAVAGVSIQVVSTHTFPLPEGSTACYPARHLPTTTQLDNITATGDCGCPRTAYSSTVTVTAAAAAPPYLPPPDT